VNNESWIGFNRHIQNVQGELDGLHILALASLSSFENAVAYLVEAVSSSLLRPLKEKSFSYLIINRLI